MRMWPKARRCRGGCGARYRAEQWLDGGGRLVKRGLLARRPEASTEAAVAQDAGQEGTRRGDGRTVAGSARREARGRRASSRGRGAAGRRSGPRTELRDAVEMAAARRGRIRGGARAAQRGSRGWEEGEGDDGKKGRVALAEERETGPLDGGGRKQRGRRREADEQRQGGDGGQHGGGWVRRAASGGRPNAVEDAVDTVISSGRRAERRRAGRAPRCDARPGKRWAAIDGDAA